MTFNNSVKQSFLVYSDCSDFQSYQLYLQIWLLSTDLLVFLYPWTLTEKNKRKNKNKKEYWGSVNQTHFCQCMCMYVHCLFSFSVHFACLKIFKLNYFSFQSSRSLCQGSGEKTTAAAVVFTPQLRSSGWTLRAQMSSK